MEDKDIMHVWQLHDQQLQEALVLNRRNAEDITRIKVKSLLSSMKPVKIFTLLVGILWVLFVDAVIFAAYQAGNPFLLVSAVIQVVLTKLAIGIYLYQLVLIYQTDISEPVVATQERIARLQSSTILVTRLLVLQMPVWTTFYLTQSTLRNGETAWLALQVVVTGVFIFAAIWLFVNIHFKNREKKWFRFIFSGKEWEPVIKAKALLEEIDTYKNALR